MDPIQARAEIIKSPEFGGLSADEQVSVLAEIDTDFASLDQAEQYSVIEQLVPKAPQLKPIEVSPPVEGISIGQGLSNLGSAFGQGVQGAAKAAIDPNTYKQLADSAIGAMQTEMASRFAPPQSLQGSIEKGLMSSPAGFGVGALSGLRDLAQGVLGLPSDIQNAYMGKQVSQPAIQLPEVLPELRKQYPVTSFIGEQLPYAVPLTKAAQATKLQQLGRAAAEGAAIGGLIDPKQSGLQGRIANASMGAAIPAGLGAAGGAASRVLKGRAVAQARPVGLSRITEPLSPIELLRAKAQLPATAETFGKVDPIQAMRQKASRAGFLSGGKKQGFVPPKDRQNFSGSNARHGELVADAGSIDITAKKAPKKYTHAEIRDQVVNLFIRSDESGEIKATDIIESLTGKKVEPNPKDPRGGGRRVFIGGQKPWVQFRNTDSIKGVLSRNKGLITQITENLRKSENAGALLKEFWDSQNIRKSEVDVELLQAKEQAPTHSIDLAMGNQERLLNGYLRAIDKARTADQLSAIGEMVAKSESKLDLIPADEWGLFWNKYNKRFEDVQKAQTEFQNRQEPSPKRLEKKQQQETPVNQEAKPPSEGQGVDKPDLVGGKIHGMKNDLYQSLEIEIKKSVPEISHTDSNYGYILKSGVRVSRNAHDAMTEGRFPLPKARALVSKVLGIPSKDAEKLTLLTTGEWHHTSNKANKTQFYDTKEALAIYFKDKSGVENERFGHVNTLAESKYGDAVRWGLEKNILSANEKGFIRLADPQGDARGKIATNEPQKPIQPKGQEAGQPKQVQDLEANKPAQEPKARPADKAQALKEAVQDFGRSQSDPQRTALAAEIYSIAQETDRSVFVGAVKDLPQDVIDDIGRRLGC